MKSLYSRIYKNNQIIYGRPYQVKTPENLLKYIEQAEDDEQSAEYQAETSTPEELLENTKQKCDMLIKEAQLEAERLIEEAKAEAKRQSDSIAEEAWQRGYAEGMEAAEKQNRELLEEAERIRDSAIAEYESMMNNMEQDMVNLVLDVSRKAVASELSLNKSVIIQLIRDALSKCSNKNGAVVKVCPEDANYLKEHMDDLLTEAEGADEVEIKADAKLKQGDCIIETPIGNVDAGATTRMDKIEAAFREELEGI